MKFSLRWLRDYATLDAPLDLLVKALVESGTAVESVTSEGEGLVVARVLALSPVAGTRNLRFADIDAGSRSGAVRLVTGARNLEAGDLVPYAPPGTRPPALEEPVGVKLIRGHRSPGMLCSAAELGVGEDAAGILVLSGGEPGRPLGEVLDLDSVFELEITTNRPDCLCHVGIARELAAVLGEPLSEPDASIPGERESASGADRRTRLRVEDREGCQRFALAVIEGVAIGRSPDWMVRRLGAVGVRPINAVVDVTNFVAHELGQPLHAFDLDKVVAEGGAELADVVVRRARSGESLVCLDGVERSLTGADVVVAAGDRVVSLAGLIGGASTAVDPGTRNVLLEAATWDGPTIRATSRRLAVRTDASALFEKGLSDALPQPALRRAAGLIAEHCSGHVLRGTVDERPRPQPDPEPITVTADFLSGLLGYPVDASEAATALAHLGFAVRQDGAILVVVPPGFRRDVRITEDVVEEVGRLLGYARVPATLPGRRHPVQGPAPPTPAAEAVRDVCAGAGFNEAITLSFTSPRLAATLPGLGEGKTPIPLRNPLNEGWSALRTGQLPGLCGALAENVRRGVEQPALFELGRVYWEGERRSPVPGSTLDGADSGLPALPLEPLLLSVATHSDAADGAASAEHIRHVQALISHLITELTGEPACYEAVAHAGLRSGRSATVRARGAGVGLVGELTAETREALDLDGRVVVGEVRLDGLLPERPRLPRFVPPPRFPAIDRDLAVVVPAERTAAQALAAIREAGGPVLEDVVLYDEYRGERVPAGAKGWTFRLTFRSEDRTLTAADADRAQEAIVTALRTQAGAEPRG